ncbi:MAG: DUF2142 domain-containing protein [Streptococcus salivarius]
MNTNTVPYTPFSYLPYVFTAYLSKIIGIKPVTEYLLMRLIGFLTYFLLFILAIKITPVGKFTLAFISTIPTVIVSWTNISADGYMVAISRFILCCNIESGLFLKARKKHYFE